MSILQDLGQPHIMENYHKVLVIVFCVRYIDVASSFILTSTAKTNCLISSWSDWTFPANKGDIYRERAILRYPENGGLPCPPANDLRQTMQIDGNPAVYAAATSVTNNFIIKNNLRGNSIVGARRDLLIIVDSSGSIGATNFDSAKQSLSELVGLLCPDPDPFRLTHKAALLEFSTGVTEVFDFDDKKDTYEVQQGINNMVYHSGATHTELAFDYATSTLFTPAKGMRTQPDVKQEVLILTDGKSNHPAPAIAAAKRLQGKADVYALLIGSHTAAGLAELDSYVTAPANKHLFAIPSYRELQDLVNIVKQQMKQTPCAPFDV